MKPVNQMSRQQLADLFGIHSRTFRECLEMERERFACVLDNKKNLRGTVLKQVIAYMKEEMGFDPVS